MSDRTKWDLKFLSLAKFWSEMNSKDPSTKVGAVIADDSHRLMGIGYNGFPRSVSDDPERYADRNIKYPMVVHAEANAILFANKTEGCTVYVWPLFTCCDCAGLLIQSGIKRVVSPPPIEERWKSQYDISEAMYRDAGIELTHYDREDVENFICHTM